VAVDLVRMVPQIGEVNPVTLGAAVPLFPHAFALTRPIPRYQ